MERDTIIKFSYEKGLGELSWIICPVCWNSMKVTKWENGTVEEECPICERMQIELLWISKAIT